MLPINTTHTKRRRGAPVGRDEMTEASLTIAALSIFGLPFILMGLAEIASAIASAVYGFED